MQLCGCPLSSPTVPVGAWLCLCVSWLSLPQCLWMSLCGPCPCPGMGVWAVPVRVSLGYPCVVPVCASPTRAGGLGGVPARVSLCACASPAAPGLCDSGGVGGVGFPQLSPRVSPGRQADREGQSPIPTPRGITRGSARLCLIPGLHGLGLARRPGGAPRGAPLKDIARVSWRQQGGAPQQHPPAALGSTCTPTHGHGVAREANQRAQSLQFIGVTGSGGGQAVPVPCCTRLRSSSSCSDSSVSFFPILSWTSRYLATQRSRHTLSPFDSSASL